MYTGSRNALSSSPPLLAFGATALAQHAAVVVERDSQSSNTTTVFPGNTYFLIATNFAPEKWRVTHNVGGNGTIAALRDLNAVSGVP
ncbi:hypothetical protein CF327_g7120 [Tilletia walkeri]|nr:hypothetical protein CF327_g7120 [Tilletia walkeri]